MHTVAYRLTSLVTFLVMMIIPVGRSAATLNLPAATGTAYYVSPAGSDANAGTSATSPLKTLAAAVSRLTAGSTLTILPGTYYERLLIKQSGTASAPITVHGSGATIDINRGTEPGIDLKGGYIVVDGLEVRNGGAICVNLANIYLTVSHLKVHNCKTHGIHAYKAFHARILSNKVFNTVRQNAARNMSGGWSSGIKIRQSNAVLVQGNRVYDNFGEGIATRGVNVIIRRNIVYDNFSANIYTNSEDATIEDNFVYCTTNTAFYRNGKPAGGITMAEEYYPGWGARLKNARIINNVVTACKNGIRYNGADSEVTGGGLKYALIAHNTLYGSVEATLGIVYGPEQAGNLIANNIIWQADNNLASIDSGTGLAFENNLWKVAPPPLARGTGDQYGAPGFVVNPPGIVLGNFRPANNSLAVGAAADLNITTDFFRAARSLVYDIGAIEASQP